MGMRAFFVIPVIVGIAVMMLVSVLPALAQSETILKFQFDDCNDLTHSNGVADRFICPVFIDSDRDGCDSHDKRFSMPLRAIINADIPPC